MATKYFCNKCDDEVKKPEELNSIDIANETITEICDRCCERLRDWLRPDMELSYWDDDDPL